MNTPDSVISKRFYKIVYTLTQGVTPAKDFEKHFKEGIFDKPNTVGFIHVSYYLLNIYDEEHFKNNVEWPLFDKKTEVKYRNNVKDFLVIVSDENKDLEFPLILTSHLVTAGGRKFINIMYKLSEAVLRKFLRKSGIVPLAKPKSSHPVANVLLKNTIAKNAVCLKDYAAVVNRVELQAKEFSEKAIESIEVAQKNLLEERQNLLQTINSVNSNSQDFKKQLSQTNDSEVIEDWNFNVNKMLEEFSQKVNRIKKIKKRSGEIKNLVETSCSNCRRILSGKDLPLIDITCLIDKLLDPNVQVALSNLYQGGKLHLNNLFIILASVLNYYRINAKHLNSPHLSIANDQVLASTEDLKLLFTTINTMKNKTIELSNELAKVITLFQPSHNSIHFHLDNEIFHSDVLKSSPVIQLKNYEPNKDDIFERLQLTPVEHPQKELLLKYSKYNDYIRSNLMLERSKLTITRINFDETLPSTSREESMNISRRTVLTQSPHSIEARIGSKMADLVRRRRGGLKLLGNQWRTSSLASENYSMYEQRPYNSFVNSVNNSLELSTPPKNSSINLSLSENLLGIKSIGNPVFNSTVSSLKTIVESTTEIKPVKEPINLEEPEKTTVEQLNGLELLCTDKEINNIDEIDVQDLNDTKKRKDRSNRRFSISDIMERYKKIRDQSICFPKTNFDSDDFTA
ncbi:uncharacterized protein dgt6 [Chelonus insularis]|uniref:uncharacterized protein dgt6 n=1 Tax=Chelonus insularis TaxID=460826 RepID=UPI00158955FC|nr:uncharacterized protein LOC118068523 [Chelonus insularis]